MKTKFWIICLLMLFASCSRNINDIYTGNKGENGGDREEEIKKEDFFDYSTIASNHLSLDYNISGITPFYLYGENPYELVEDEWRMKEIDAVYAGFTDENGRYSGDIILPSCTKKVWLATNHVFVSPIIELEVDPTGGISYTRTKRNRGGSRAAMGIIDGYSCLGTWNENGEPDYLLSEKLELPSAFVKRCNGVMNLIKSNYNNLLEKYPELKTTGTNDIVIKKNTELTFTYFTPPSSSNFCNMVAYYTYKEGETVDLKTIKKTLLLPLSTGTNKKWESTAFLAEEQIKLKYWNEATQSYQDEFPAGVHIGWVIPVYYSKDKWMQGATPDRVRYSNPQYNSSGWQYSLFLVDPEVDNCFFVAIEDSDKSMQFNDVFFSLTSLVSGAVVAPSVIPEETSKDETIDYVVNGTLAYEDNWPKKGDYDMNDVVLRFEGKIFKKSNNRVIRVKTVFTAVNNGAIYTNGFGIQLDKLDRRSLASTDGVSVSCDGNIYLSEFEEGTDKPTLILFNDLKSMLDKHITVDIKLNGSAVNEDYVRPPFNPFIMVNSREHEVHLPGYIPTSKMDDSLRGKDNDLREDSFKKEMYFISKDNKPFALYVPRNDFAWPTEGQDITNKYPTFTDWQQALGASSQDWYFNPAN